MIKKYLLFLFVLTGFTQLIAQSTSFTFPKSATVNASEIEDDLYPQLIFTEVKDGISFDKKILKDAKRAVQEKYPRKASEKNELRGGDVPQILQGIKGIEGSLGIPLDNHLAVSNSGNVATVANFHMATYDDQGTYIKGTSLIQLTRRLALPDLRFDPRVIYDTEEEKFILVMLQGTSSDNTVIIVGFSENDDPNGNWNFYKVEGNPFGINIFSDYPMLSLTKDNFYLTINAVNADTTWQAGFVETYIWEFDKASGFAGGNLESELYKDITIGGKPIRNLCPVTSGDGNLLNTQYFLSNRNFAVDNDTIFLVQLDNGQTSVRVLSTDVPYSVPPNAVQDPSLSLQTNDARILDAFIQEDHIQFVGNCANPANGHAVIYHGLIEDIDNATTVSGSVIAYGDLELGYPDISFMGIQPGERHSIIVTSHVGEGRFPGVSALEYDGQDFSDLISLHEGDAYIARIGGALQRWGDYSGNQRRYNVPGSCWTVSSFGRSDRNYGIWISELGRAGINVATKDETIKNLNVFPNPAFEWVDVHFEVKKRVPINIELYNLQGQLVESIAEVRPRHIGKATFRISTHSLAEGTYTIIAKSQGQIVFSESLVVK